MDNETNPNENDSEVVESTEQINENGCNEQSDTDRVNDLDDKDSPEQSSESDDKKDDEDCMSPKPSTLLHEAQSESDQFGVTDSDNPSDSSPDKGRDVSLVVSSPIEMECDETANDKSWRQINDSSPEKSRSDVACVVSSPSESVECEESTNDKGWCQLNESVSEGGIYDDSMDDEPDSEDDDVDNDYIDRSSPKAVFKQRDSVPKPDVECPVFELTDDNSSAGEPRSEADDDIDGDEMGEEEEDDESGKLFD